jgi:hypothetical protein
MLAAQQLPTAVQPMRYTNKIELHILRVVYTFSSKIDFSRLFEVYGHLYEWNR